MLRPTAAAQNADNRGRPVQRIMSTLTMPGCDETKVVHVGSSRALRPRASPSRLRCPISNVYRIDGSIIDWVDAHFDSSVARLADNPKVENFTTSDGFLVTD
jgi:hypothetical protein